MGRIKRFLSDSISLNSNTRSYIFLFILISLFLVPVEFLEKMPNLSICQKILGEYCYSEGLTRGLSALLKGNFSLAIEYNFLVMPVFVVMFGIMIFDFYRKLNSSN